MDNITYEYAVQGPFRRSLIDQVAKLPIVTGDIEITQEQLAEHYTIKTVFTGSGNDGTRMTIEELEMKTRVRRLRHQMNREILDKIDLVERLGDQDVFWRPGTAPIHTLTRYDVKRICEDRQRMLNRRGGYLYINASSASSSEGEADIQSEDEQPKDKIQEEQSKTKTSDPVNELNPDIEGETDAEQSTDEPIEAKKGKFTVSGLDTGVDWTQSVDWTQYKTMITYNPKQNEHTGSLNLNK